MRGGSSGQLHASSAGHILRLTEVALAQAALGILRTPAQEDVSEPCVSSSGISHGKDG